MPPDLTLRPHERGVALWPVLAALLATSFIAAFALATTRTAPAQVRRDAARTPVVADQGAPAAHLGAVADLPRLTVAARHRAPRHTAVRGPAPAPTIVATPSASPTPTVAPTITAAPTAAPTRAPARTPAPTPSKPDFDSSGGFDSSG